jgi:membrane protein
MAKSISLVTKLLRQSFIDIYRVAKDSNMQLLTSSLSFTTIFSLVPLLAISFSVFKTLGGLDELRAKLELFITENLAPGAGEMVQQLVWDSVGRVHSGALGVSGLIFLVFAATKIFLDIERSFEKIWKVSKGRRFTLKLIMYWSMILLGSIGIAVFLGVASTEFVQQQRVITPGISGTLLLVLVFWGLYIVLPPTKVYARWAFLGSLISVFTLKVVGQFYTIITTEILNYNKVYGGLAAFPIFLLWILLFWWIFLGGGVVAAGLQNRTMGSQNKK